MHFMKKIMGRAYCTKLFMVVNASL